MNDQKIEFECSNLSLKLGDKILFHHFNFQFEGPGVVLIEGENGTGKSTLLKVFAGFVEAQNSRILVRGQVATEINSKEFSFFTTTSQGLLNDFTGREHIELVARSMRLDAGFVTLKIAEFQNFELFNEILCKPISDFSQGMKQFLRLFLHLFFQPRVLFLDEPFLFLSPVLKDFIQEKIDSLSNTSLIFITDHKFSWIPKNKNDKIVLGLK